MPSPSPDPTHPPRTLNLQHNNKGALPKLVLRCQDHICCSHHTQGNQEQAMMLSELRVSGVHLLSWNMRGPWDAGLVCSGPLQRLLQCIQLGLQPVDSSGLVERGKHSDTPPPSGRPSSLWQRAGRTVFSCPMNFGSLL